MQFLVDARYVNHQPRLRVLNADTGEVLLQWQLQQVREMFDNGEVPEEDFLNPQKYGMKLLVKNLFLLACAQKLQQAGSGNPYLAYNLLDCREIEAGGLSQE